MTSNPLVQPWTTPYELPPFADVRAEHFKPAFEAAMAEQRAEIDAIAANATAPSFDNTIAALDRSGRLLARVESLFHNLGASETSPELQAVEREMAVPLAAHGSAIYMNARLFKRVDALHAERDQLGLSAEQRRLIERVHLDFVRAGAKLEADAQKRYAEVVQRLAELHTRFSQNVLADESSFRLVLRDERDLAGLPDFVRAAARQAAAERGISDAHVITLSRSHIVPFLTFSQRRDLREQAWRAWVSRGEHDGAHDNRPIAREILTLRHEQARLHGYACYADYVLADTMAGTRSAVNDLLDKVWAPAAERAAEEQRDLVALAAAFGEPTQVEAWDWRYLAEKLRRQRFDVDEAAVKPYFPLERMVEAAFDCAHRLFGLRFVVRSDLRAYHPDVKVYEVRQGEDLIGLFLHDNFARPTKRSGAWMSLYRQQSRGADGVRVVPIVANNNNFAKGAPGEPTLLSFDDARTLFHEFGHGLHGLLSNVDYERLSGTNVLRDFVELPSQLFEHWLGEREVLKRHARHHATGEPIPDELVQRIEAASKFNQGYETLRYLASAKVDMAVHSRTEAEGPDIVAFERAEVERMGLPAAVGMNHRLPHFLHLFAGAGYAAGYYVYLWAEVLDADGYDAFTEAGDPFDAAVAQRLREHIYSSGNSREPREAYRAFRGRDPEVQPMLRERGLLEGLLEDVRPA
ncbi:M3 family metallopeptidase [Piscinibacter sp. HJYY11]|uniref:M3 family metallopeptidase n=1 Tax=Piscinibacter sp. HJYY11 TaxID=2801333 RepID=UPI0019201864|nr:M3 family metallopeptidase [Piscinibacter sp. HJYY11]MBL0727446.1 M3 family metallopeptidase [Piscinibacter sp. HJYY11]